MKNCKLFLPVLLLLLFTACETPSDSFERVNTNDPASPNFSGGTVTGLSAEADSSGIVTLRWPSADNSVSKHIIEKSLGDSLSFSPIAELEPNETTFVDDSRDIRLDTYYRLSSYMEVNGIGDVLYGRTDTKLEFGAISAVEYEFLDEDNQLKLKWHTDVPFFTHFVIHSENVLTEDGDKSVKISAGSTKHQFVDPLTDIDFKSRRYTVTGIIENDGVDEEVAVSEFIFNTAAFFKPQNVGINVLNEQDWKITWENSAFFAKEVELVREINHRNDLVVKLLPETRSYTDSRLLGNPEDMSDNQYRRYRLRFLTDNGESEALEVNQAIRINQPSIGISITSQLDPNSLTIRGTVLGDYSDLIKEYIIEKPHPNIPDRFVEIGRVNGGQNYQFTDTDVSEGVSPAYRVRTLTSIPSRTATFAYSHDYELDQEFDIGMQEASYMQTSSDNRYLALVNLELGLYRGNPILIYDFETGNEVASIQFPSKSISDFKISPDGSSIFFVVPKEQAIYKADFPSGNNVQKVIDDAGVNNVGVYQIAISSDESFLVGSGGRGFIKKWDFETFEPQFLFTEASTPSNSSNTNVAISQDGNMIAGNNGKPFIMDADDGSIITYLQWTDRYVYDLQFSNDGQFHAFVSRSTIQLYSTESWERIKRIVGGSRVSFHPEKKTMLVMFGNLVTIYDPETLRVVDVVSSSDGSRPAPYHGNKILYLDDDRILSVTNDQSVQVWDIAGLQKRWKSLY